MQAIERLRARLNAILEQDPARGRNGVFFARLGYRIVGHLTDGQLNLWAMSLVYTTLLSLVPLLAVSFSVLKAFGVQNQLEPALLEFLAPLGAQSSEVSRQLIGFVDKVQVGVLGAVGIGFLFYTVVSLLQKVEQAMNTLWQVPGTRPLARRFSDYLSVILVAPVLIFAAIGVAASVRNHQVVLWLLRLVEPLDKLILFIGQMLLPYLLICLAFTFLYKFLINTVVKLSAALAGGVFAGLLWSAVGALFTRFIVSSSNYSAVYSGFAAAILFIMWLNIGWLVTLVGAQVAFYWQNPQRLALPPKPIANANRRREALALALMTLIGRSHAYNRPRWTLAALSAFYPAVPEATLAELIQALGDAKLIVASAEQPPSYLPARAIETITLREVLAAVHDKARSNLRAVDTLISQLDTAIAQVLGERTLKDLLPEEPDPAPALVVVPRP